MTQASRMSKGSAMFTFDKAWLARHDEEVIEPALPIIDPHHHLWDHDDSRYLFHDLLDDTGSGHNIRATVYLQCRSMYRADGPVELRPVGETEFVNGVAAMSATGNYGEMRACAGIIGQADLGLGARVRDVLNAHVAAGGGRFRGIRYGTAWDKDVQFAPVRPPQGIMLDKTWREGLAQLAPMGMTFDAIVYHTQLGELIDLARASPQTTIVLDHVGFPLAIGPYADKRDAVFVTWRAAMKELAKHENVVVKVGGLGMHLFGFGFETRETPASSEELAKAWKPYVDICIDAFGPKRAMFESNFPVDKMSCSYKVLWNAFKRVAAGYSKDEKAALFHDTAARVYRLAY